MYNQKEGELSLIVSPYEDGKRRDRFTLIRNILLIANRPIGAKKIDIMYKGNFSFNNLNAYMSVLLKRGLLQAYDKKGEPINVTKPKGGLIYRTTKNGRELLKAIEKQNRLMEESPSGGSCMGDPFTNSLFFV